MKCEVFDDLWKKNHFVYEIPKKSFCSHSCRFPPKIGIYIGKKDPFWLECTKDIMPFIEFYFKVSGVEKNCNVDTMKGSTDKNVTDCIKQITDNLKHAKSPDDTKLIYISHGWQADLTGQREIYWGHGMKNSLLKKYPGKQVVVGVVNWQRGGRMYQFKSGGRNANVLKSSIKGNVIDDVKNAIVKRLFCCAPKKSPLHRYGVAAANTWAVGNILAYLNEEIVQAMPSKIRTYCIGFSLGSHVCGFFGKMFKSPPSQNTITKIIGVDPAGPIFEFKNQDTKLRLNKNDADEVEIIHTNTRSLGYTNPLGDVDFYINGGWKQPSCNQFSSIKSIKKALKAGKPGDVIKLDVACSHKYGQELMSEILEKDYTCYSRWNCTNTKGLDETNVLKDIEKENPNKLTSKNCTMLKQNNEIKLGQLNSDANNVQGVYWVEADKTKTCKILNL